MRVWKKEKQTARRILVAAPCLMAGFLSSPPPLSPFGLWCVFFAAASDYHRQGWERGWRERVLWWEWDREGRQIKYFLLEKAIGNVTLLLWFT